LERIAKEAFDLHNARLWFVEILGKRWSYIAGLMPEGPSPKPSTRIDLGDGIGLVIESWGNWTPAGQEGFVAFLRAYLGERARVS